MVMAEQKTPSPAQTFESYFVPAIFNPWAPVLLEYAAPRPGDRVLDLASATGIVARHTAPIIGPGGRVVALDINPDMLAVGSSLPAPEGAAIEWRQGNAMALDLPDNSFDLVLCQQGLQFFQDRAAASREMKRVLAEDGRVALSLWQSLNRHPVYETVLESVARNFGAPLSQLATPYSLSAADEIHALLSEAGFRRIEIISRSLDAHFPQPQKFVQLSAAAYAAVDPNSPAADRARRDAAMAAITQEIQPILQSYTKGDQLVFPMHWHLISAYA